MFNALVFWSKPDTWGQKQNFLLAASCQHLKSLVLERVGLWAFGFAMFSIQRNGLPAGSFQGTDGWEKEQRQAKALGSLSNPLETVNSFWMCSHQKGIPNLSNELELFLGGPICGVLCDFPAAWVWIQIHPGPHDVIPHNAIRLCMDHLSSESKL